MTQHDQLHRYLFENYAVRGELVTVSETLEQILEYPLILTEKNMSYRAALDDLLSQNGRETMPIMEVGDTQLIRNLLVSASPICRSSL
jgi:hypothetical protein